MDERLQILLEVIIGNNKSETEELIDGLKECEETEDIFLKELLNLNETYTLDLESEEKDTDIEQVEPREPIESKDEREVIPLPLESKDKQEMVPLSLESGSVTIENKNLELEEKETEYNDLFDKAKEITEEVIGYNLKEENETMNIIQRTYNNVEDIEVEQLTNLMLSFRVKVNGQRITESLYDFSFSDNPEESINEEINIIDEEAIKENKKLSIFKKIFRRR